jgi:protein translocase SecG subunit
MNQIFTYAQIILGILLIVTILLQQRGGGMSSLIGGGSMEYATKRGAEKVIFIASVVTAVLFIGVSVARLVLA